MKDYSILIFSYNRPSHLKRVLISLENYKKKNINVILDGPKNKRDKLIQEEVKKVIMGDQKIKLNFIFRKKNLGLAKSIVKALDYYSRKYEYLIIIEDDCIPRKEFFSYIKKGIKMNKLNNTIGAVCGYQLPELHEKNNKNLNLYLLDHFIPWGWAILSKNWIKFRNEFKNILIKKKNIKLSENLSQIIKITKHKERNIWTRNFILYNFYKRNKFLYPGKSLIKNIGFDGSGINSKITDIFYTKYSKSKKISSTLIENNKLIKHQEKILTKLVKYYY